MRLLMALLGLTVLASACAPESIAGGTDQGQASGKGGAASGGAPGSGTGGSPAPAGSGGGPAATATGGASGASGTAGASTGGGPGGGRATGGSGLAGGSGVAGGPGAAGSAGARGTPAGGGGAGAALGGGGAGAAGSSGSAASGCAGKTYKLCEDFETGTAGGLPTGWTVYQGYGSGSAADAALATDQAHSGHMALKSNSASTGQRRVQHSLSALGATASKHWGRVFYKVQSPPPISSSNGVLHVTWVGLHGGNQENRVVDIVESNTRTHQWLYNNPDDKGSLGSAYSWSFDTAWHCAEWSVDVGTKSYRFFSDGAEVKSIGFTNKSDSEMVDYTAVIVGATFYQTPASSWIMWFDDLAIDDNQIGCQ